MNRDELKSLMYDKIIYVDIDFYPNSAYLIFEYEGKLHRLKIHYGLPGHTWIVFKGLRFGLDFITYL